MRHVPMATLYPWLELTCPICDEDTDYPVHDVDYEQIWNSKFQQPICHCGHKYSMIEVRRIGVIYG